MKRWGFDEPMRLGWASGARLVVAVLSLPAQDVAVSPQVITGFPAAHAGELVSDQEPLPSTSARSRASASASASATGEPACESRATASASARAGDRQVSEYDEETAVADDGKCSAGAHASASAAQSSPDEPGE